MIPKVVSKREAVKEAREVLSQAASQAARQVARQVAARKTAPVKVLGRPGKKKNRKVKFS